MTLDSLPREWQILQRNIDSCSCQKHPCFDVSDHRRPARPMAPIRSGGLLLIAEAPPPDGGFWNAQTDDDLRTNLLGLLPSGSQALTFFVEAKFSLVHTLKWSLTSRGGKRLNYVSLKPSEQRELVNHTTTHLREEISLLEPTGILAMGTAAW
jgi:hypothetical protein